MNGNQIQLTHYNKTTFSIQKYDTFVTQTHSENIVDSTIKTTIKKIADKKKFITSCMFRARTSLCLTTSILVRSCVNFCFIYIHIRTDVNLYYICEGDNITYIYYLIYSLLGSHVNKNTIVYIAI